MDPITSVPQCFSASVFPGFTLPDGAWLPPEIMAILPDLKLAELKVTIAAIHQSLTVGGNSTCISLSDFQALTGLDRKSVITGIDSAVNRGTILRQPLAGTYLYQLNLVTQPSGSRPASGKFPLPDVTQSSGLRSASGKIPLPASGKNPPIGGNSPPISGKFPLPGAVCMHACNIDPEETNIHTDQAEKTGRTENCHAQRERSEESPLRPQLVAEMRALGVALKIAQSLAGRYDPAYLLEKLRQARFAVEKQLANHPAGWFIASVREDWQPPLGYDPDAHLTPEQQRARYTTGKYADIIQH